MCCLHHESGTFHYGSFLRASVYIQILCGTIFHKTFGRSPIGLWIWLGNIYRNVSDVLFIIRCTRWQCKPLDFHLLFKVLMSFAIQSCELQWPCRCVHLSHDSLTDYDQLYSINTGLKESFSRCFHSVCLLCVYILSIKEHMFNENTYIVFVLPDN